MRSLLSIKYAYLLLNNSNNIINSRMGTWMEWIKEVICLFSKSFDEYLCHKRI